jgi:hypothetical protein
MNGRFIPGTAKTGASLQITFFQITFSSPVSERLRIGRTVLELAFYFGGSLTDIYGLAHCNERGRARTDARRADNGDNLGWRNVDRGPMWARERHKKSQDHRQNGGHVLLPLALFMSINFRCATVAGRATRNMSKRSALGMTVVVQPRKHSGNPLNNSAVC